MLNIEKIENRSDLEYFAARYKERSHGGIVSPEYLADSYVYALKNEIGKIVGGFILNNSAAKRLVSYIPEDQRSQVKELEITSSEVMEITCIWVERGVFSTHLKRLSFYASIITEAASYKESKYCIGGSDNPKLMNIQMAGFEKVIWEGVPTSNSDYQWIYISRQRPLVRRIVGGAVRMSGIFLKKNTAQMVAKLQTSLGQAA